MGKRACSFVTKRICKHVRCRQEFTIMNTVQVYCRTCCPSDIVGSYQRLKLYGMSHPEFETMLRSQNNCCALCDEALKMSGPTGLNIDHCHVTGKIRGIVCHKCNMMLGFVDKGDWFNKLQRVANYIANGYYT